MSRVEVNDCDCPPGAEHTVVWREVGMADDFPWLHGREHPAILGGVRNIDRRLMVVPQQPAR